MMKTVLGMEMNGLSPWEPNVTEAFLNLFNKYGDHSVASCMYGIIYKTVIVQEHVSYRFCKSAYT